MVEFSGILFTNFENVKTTLSLLGKKKVALGTLGCIKSENFKETSGKYLTEPVHK